MIAFSCVCVRYGVLNLLVTVASSFLLKTRAGSRDTTLQTTLVLLPVRPPRLHARLDRLDPMNTQHHGQREAQSGLLQAATDGQLLDSVISSITIFSDSPIALITGSYALVTAADMVPFVPCQPLAVALGAKLGFSVAFPVTVAGQTTAGILAFSFARRAADTDLFRDAATAKLRPDALDAFEKFRNITAGGTKKDDRNVLLSLIGLRLAPFFPFSAGNYLLGSATAVPLYLFTIATLFGCILSNFVSTSIGAGGAMILHL